jgi:hypothetical protein
LFVGGTALARIRRSRQNVKQVTALKTETTPVLVPFVGKSEPTDQK